MLSTSLSFSVTEIQILQNNMLYIVTTQRLLHIIITSYALIR